MLLAIDIGNTNICNGIFKGGALKKTFRIPTYSSSLKSQYLKNVDLPADRIIIVSVVPKALKEVKKIFGEEVLVVGKDIDSGAKNLYEKPKQVGQDRLVNARAAYELYKGACIIVDFGTAITIDIINKHREYLGGVIVPGVEISLDALSKRAALLPRVALKKPKAILGRETRQSMISGAVYGFSSLCDGLVERLKKKYCRDAKVIATGGLSRFLSPYCKEINKVDPYLTLKGLQIIARDV